MVLFFYLIFKLYDKLPEENSRICVTYITFSEGQRLCDVGHFSMVEYASGAFDFYLR